MTEEVYKVLNLKKWYRKGFIWQKSKSPDMIVSNITAQLYYSSFRYCSEHSFNSSINTADAAWVGQNESWGLRR